MHHSKLPNKLGTLSKNLMNIGYAGLSVTHEALSTSERVLPICREPLKAA